MNHVWVIEMLVKGKWLPCSECAFTRKEAERIKKSYWQEDNPDNEYRVWKYQAVPERNRKHERLMKALRDVK